MLLRIATVLLCIIGPNSGEASLSQLLLEMKNSFKMPFSDNQEAANLMSSQRKMWYRSGNSKEAKGFIFT